MNKIFISETSSNKGNMTYLYNSLSQSITDCKAKADVDIDDKRVNVTYSVDSKFCDFFKLRLEDKIAEIIAISYKYAFFKEKIKTTGLSSNEFEYLLAALIAADYDDDVKFIKAKLKNIDIYTIDGFFNFRLCSLKSKWEEIAGYIPAYFTSLQLKDFITFLINEGNKDRKVFIENGNVYDKHYNKLEKSRLLKNGFEDGETIIELILSRCSKVEVKGALDKCAEKYLSEYFDGRIDFSQNFFS